MEIEKLNRSVSQKEFVAAEIPLIEPSLFSSFCCSFCSSPPLTTLEKHYFQEVRSKYGVDYISVLHEQELWDLLGLAFEDDKSARTSVEKWSALGFSVFLSSGTPSSH